MESIASSEAILSHCANFLNELSEKATMILAGGAKGLDLSGSGSILPDKRFLSSMTELDRAVTADRELSGVAGKLHSEVEGTRNFFFHHADVLNNQFKTEYGTDQQLRWTQLDAAETELVPMCERIVETLLDITSTETGIRNAQLKQQSRARTVFNLILLAVALLGVIASVVLALLCVRDLRSAMVVLMTNADKMANREELLPALPANNEFNQLDDVFHTVDEAIEDSLNRERAVFEFAADLVCSLDRHGVFQYANPSVFRMLGYRQEQLSGKSFLDIVARADCARADEEFSAASRIHEPRSFELKLLRTDNQELDSDWSVLWSKVDRRLFCVVSDITERKNVERLKQDFVSMIRDEIRSPLSAVEEAIAEVLSGGTGDVPEAARAELATCRTTADRLIELITELLRFETMQTDIMQFKLSTVQLGPVIERSIREVQTLANSSEVNLRFKEQRLRAVADEHRLMQLLVNLLSNAIRYSPRGGAVSVELNEIIGFVEIAVCDEGPGVPDDAKEKIFMPFEQAPGSKETASGGTGLGLAIAKLIVDGHHGNIGVKSGRNGGSVFWFTLPTQVQ